MKIIRRLGRLFTLISIAALFPAITRPVVGRERGTRIFENIGIGTATATRITNLRIYSQAINPASVAANVIVEQTFTVTGLTTDDKVFVNPGAALTVGIAGVRVSAANTLAVTFVNPTAGALDAASSTWQIIAIRS